MLPPAPGRGRPAGGSGRWDHHIATGDPSNTGIPNNVEQSASEGADDDAEERVGGEVAGSA